MDDPRFAELACLMHLEREGPLVVAVPKGSTEGMFGLAVDPLREMLAGFIEQDLVNGNATAMDDDRSAPDNNRNLASDARLADLNHLRFGRRLTLRLNHKGKTYLYRLRDELRAFQGREQFGILYDRRAYDRELRVQLEFATSEHPLSLLYVDLDGFKQVNDGPGGHEEGDRVLKGCFEIIRDVTEERAYRIGGDEVAAILPATQLADAESIAEKIRTAVEARFRDEAAPVTTSIGVAAFNAPVDPKIAARFVDAKMYEAKKQGGKNCARSGLFTSPPAT
jgi:diguanylate cyclase (GGDEF)-like protein